LGAAPPLSLPPRSLLVAVGLVDCGVTLATMLADMGGWELVAMLLSGVCMSMLAVSCLPGPQKHVWAVVMHTAVHRGHAMRHLPCTFCIC
jgi:hypothetical protein